ncbi:MAG: HEAT repeat domain-containing protein [Planctomycetes bacterium]|nr:HEAT repeat domain-containing protein [Planctomycetota bacterium]MBL7037352.1 HEAT repeat domain-containing protein [Pirellulaceae bacterium]
MCSLSRFGLCVASIVAASASDAEDEQSGIRTRADLDAAIAQLGSKETRSAALERLIPYASMRVFQVGSVFGHSGDAEKDALIGNAAEVIAQYRDFETLSMAVNSSSETLQYWALFRFPVPPFDSDDPWENLLPRLRDLATTGSSQIRGSAQDRLACYDDQRAFLGECLERDTSAANVMRLLYHLDRSTYRQRMSSHILHLLCHDEQAVRRSALVFVGSNSDSAPMWQFNFSGQVLARVLELSRSPSAVERGSAVSALTELRKQYHLRKQYSDAIRNRMFKLADDPSADVRWRVPLALRDEIERPDVHAVLADLLQDESPLVRYFAILAMGPNKHMDELRELASNADKKVAEYATGQLKNLERKRP